MKPMQFIRPSSLCAVLCLCASLSAAQSSDVLVADFEAKSYGEWTVTGEAFGPGPAEGTLAHQMNVDGYQGKHLVNSFYGGDQSTGTLTSPPVEIQRKYINFLVGGGKHPDETCINLLIDGNVVRTACGPNERPGGSERLDWHSWDVVELKGRKAVVQIVDNHTGGWGHINVDHIVQSDRKRQTEPAEREIEVRTSYLHIPIQNDAPMQRMEFKLNGKTVQAFDVQLALDEPDWWSYYEAQDWIGQTVTVHIDRLPSESEALRRLRQSNDLPGLAAAYEERYRPQYHFTPVTGWTNDPNGLAFYKGEHHLFYQHNEFSTRWGNMTWGHAVSNDLVHWEHLPNAIWPDKLGTIYSGSAVIDHDNTSGFQTGDEKVLVCFYTSAGSHAITQVPYTQSMAYSNDRGRTFTKYEGNPIVENIHGSNRDPKVFWHIPSQQWVMALYLARPGEFALLGSPNLKEWSKLCDVKLDGADECPDMFELAVDGKADDTLWVFWGANGKYVLGTFDGERFDPAAGPFQSEWGKNFYAAQTWSDVPEPDGRCLQIGWMNGGVYPEMPFNQQMSVPCELTLESHSEGVRLHRKPVRELEALRTQHHELGSLVLKADANLTPGIQGCLFEVLTAFETDAETNLTFSVNGTDVVYNAKEQTVTCLERTAPLTPQNGPIQMRIFADRTSLEVFCNDGKVVLSFCVLPEPSTHSLAVRSSNGETRFRVFDVWNLKSAW